MEEFKILVAKTLTDTEQILYSSTLGSIVKTILMNNIKTTEVEATLTIDGVAFKFKLTPGETKVLNSPIFTKSLKGMGEGINIHITGLELGGAIYG